MLDSSSSPRLPGASRAPGSWCPRSPSPFHSRRHSARQRRRAAQGLRSRPPSAAGDRGGQRRRRPGPAPPGARRRRRSRCSALRPSPPAARAAAAHPAAGTPTRRRRAAGAAARLHSRLRFCFRVPPPGLGRPRLPPGSSCSRAAVRGEPGPLRRASGSFSGAAEHSLGGRRGSLASGTGTPAPHAGLDGAASPRRGGRVLGGGGRQSRAIAVPGGRTGGRRAVVQGSRGLRRAPGGARAPESRLSPSGRGRSGRPPSAGVSPRAPAAAPHPTPLAHTSPHVHTRAGTAHTLARTPGWV